ncbi:uncharacterized protein LOC110613407 isoform X2 [Manihot esculenta]|uniref:Uncharacterized protein n=2 Tax=Manihot esculenta TaxID=3983 RepID=A0ACB7HTT4_MANES|nr:uncharacterized protein LOC110613407 isoform X2 [Manihot esculenta]KAG8655349.1 hypothetical protein MANES_04G031200v8 [Manihot esculenta]
MSFQNKGFWMAKGADGDPSFDNPSRIEPKRSHQWFVDAAEPELFPNKKQALQTPNSTSSSQVSCTNISSWDNPSGFQSVQNQFIHRFFGPETARSVNFSERTICPAMDDSNASVSLSMSHTFEDPEACLSYNGFRKVKVNQVKDIDNSVHDPKGHSFINESSIDISEGHTFNRENESSFISMGQAYDKEDGNVTLMAHSYNRDAHIVSTCAAYMKGDDNSNPISDTYSKEDANMISFGGFHDARDIIPVGRPISSYDQSYNQPSVQTPEAVREKELDTSNANAAASNTRVAKSKPESVSKNKQEVKTARKEAPNSFPSNVRSLISTGMLDGVPVKYVSLAREELRGIIKGSGYLCSCQSCNYSKVLNAYEFERHAGCKTKHPNNHIYFENGKTIYQIVQELRSTPESMLFDVIQTVFGAPINQKSFRIWKESFQAATRELQRIYGKEELNL